MQLQYNEIYSLFRHINPYAAAHKHLQEVEQESDHSGERDGLRELFAICIHLIVGKMYKDVRWICVQ